MGKSTYNWIVYLFIRNNQFHKNYNDVKDFDSAIPDLKERIQ